VSERAEAKSEDFVVKFIGQLNPQFEWAQDLELPEKGETQRPAHALPQTEFNPVRPQAG
jgi:hypothetical protein